MRSRLAEGGALAMRLSLVCFLRAARCGAAISLPLKRRSRVHYHRRPEVSTSVNRRAGTRELLVQRAQSRLWIKRRSAHPTAGAVTDAGKPRDVLRARFRCYLPGHIINMTTIQLRPARGKSG